MAAVVVYGHPGCCDAGFKKVTKGTVDFDLPFGR